VELTVEVDQGKEVLVFGAAAQVLEILVLLMPPLWLMGLMGQVEVALGLLQVVAAETEFAL
jgi:hypothetical protein